MKRAWLCGASAVAVSVVTGFWATAALAQPAQTGQPAPADQPAGVGSVQSRADVTVVATRREANVQKVPVAVSAFSSRQRQILGITNTQQLSDFTPGLSYFSSNDRAYIRGIGRNTVNLATESGVATYYDGVYYGANATIAIQHDTLFIGNIEVDRGPQNTLHGSNADGGTINYISQRPTKQLYAEARVGVASYKEYYAEAVLSGPITDWLRFRIGGNYTQQDGGFFRNLVGSPEGGYLAQGNNGNQHYIEAQLEGNFGAHLDGWAKLSSGEYTTSFHTTAPVGTIGSWEFPNASLSPSGFYGLCGLPGNSGILGCAGPGSQPIVPGSVVTDRVFASQFPGNNPANNNIRDFIQDYHDSNKQTNDIAFATRWTYHFPIADLQYIGGYQSFYYNLGVSGSGYDAGVQSYQLAGLDPAHAAICPFVPGIGATVASCEAPLTIFPTQEHTHFVEDEQYYSNELSLASTQAGPLQWIAGLYWYHEHYNQPVDVGCLPNQPQLANPLLTTLAPAAPDPKMCLFQLDSHLTYDSYAGFGQLTYQITPEWKIEGAARYTDDHKTGYENHRVIGFDQLLLGLPYFGSSTPALDITTLAISHVASPGTGVAFLTPNGTWQRNFGSSWNAVTGEVTLNWQPDPTMLGYAKYSRGYKTGGFNSGFIAANPKTAPEYVDAFEIGAKKRFGNVFQLNGAAFYYNYQNDQQPLSVQNAATNTISSLIFNIPSVHTYGLELEGIWTPIEPLSFDMQYSYLSATVASMNGACVENTLDPLGILPGSKHGHCPVSAGVQLVDLVGARLPETPQNKVSISAIYTAHFNPGDIVLSGSFIWKDQTYGSIFNNPQALAPSYSQWNVRAQFNSASNRYTLSAFINNIGDATGYDIVTGSKLSPGGVPYNIIQVKSLTFPVTAGMELQVRWP